MLRQIETTTDMSCSNWISMATYSGGLFVNSTSSVFYSILKSWYKLTVGTDRRYGKDDCEIPFLQLKQIT